MLCEPKTFKFTVIIMVYGGWLLAQDHRWSHNFLLL